MKKEKRKKEEKKQVLLRVTTPIYEFLSHDAQVQGISIPNVIRVILYEHYKKKGGEE